MKKLLSCLVGLMMLLSFSGCASKTEEDTAALKDGTYSSSVSGMNDKINVTLTLANGKIEKVTVDSHNETPGIGGELKDSEGNDVTKNYKISFFFIVFKNYCGFSF